MIERLYKITACLHSSTINAAPKIDALFSQSPSPHYKIPSTAPASSSSVIPSLWLFMTHPCPEQENKKSLEPLKPQSVSSPLKSL